jgi:CheY-like chemotaxis protein
MTKDVLARAFEPFFTTKESGKGSGMGLSQVLGFAKQSGGGIRIDTRVGEGTAVKVYLPRAAEESAMQGSVAAADTARPARKGAVILLVDDDGPVREITATLLEENGYVVLKAGSGGAALELLERHAKVDLALLDFAMPGMSGTELARQIAQKAPALPILFVTGYADTTAFRDVDEERIIKKPFVAMNSQQRSKRR